MACSTQAVGVYIWACGQDRTRDAAVVDVFSNSGPMRVSAIKSPCFIRSFFGKAGGRTEMFGGDRNVAVAHQLAGIVFTINCFGLPVWIARFGWQAKCAACAPVCRAVQANDTRETTFRNRARRVP